MRTLLTFALIVLNIKYDIINVSSECRRLFAYRKGKKWRIRYVRMEEWRGGGKEEREANIWQLIYDTVATNSQPCERRESSNARTCLAVKQIKLANWIATNWLTNQPTIQPTDPTTNRPGQQTASSESNLPVSHSQSHSGLLVSCLLSPAAIFISVLYPAQCLWPCLLSPVSFLLSPVSPLAFAFGSTQRDWSLWYIAGSERC